MTRPETMLTIGGDLHGEEMVLPVGWNGQRVHRLVADGAWRFHHAYEPCHGYMVMVNSRLLQEPTR